MIPTLMVLVGLAAGAIFGYLFGQRQTATACAEQLNAHQKRADAAEQAFADYRKTAAAQIDHAFSMCHRIVNEVKGQMQTTREALASAVEMTKQAASMILPPDVTDEDLAPRSIADGDRRAARLREQELSRERRG